MKGAHIISLILLIAGGLNWLLVGLGDWNVVAYLGPMLARIVYILVGLAALYEIFTHKKWCRACDSSKISSTSTTTTTSSTTPLQNM